MSDETRSVWGDGFIADRVMPVVTGRVLTRIDAPSTTISVLRARFETHRRISERAGVFDNPLLDRLEAVPIYVANDLPMRTVRYTYSDGSTRAERLR